MAVRREPASARAVVLTEVDGPDDEIDFDTKANATITWAHRNGAPPGASDALSRTLSTLKLPAGDYYAWVACESLTTKGLRQQLITDHGANPKWMRAAAYCRRGDVAVHYVHASVHISAAEVERCVEIGWDRATHSAAIGRKSCRGEGSQL